MTSKPTKTPAPFQNGAEAEPTTGLFKVRTGRTRQIAKWGAAIAALTALLSPIVNSVANRIYPPERERYLEQQLRECRQRLEEQ